MAQCSADDPMRTFKAEECFSLRMKKSSFAQWRNSTLLRNHVTDAWKGSANVGTKCGIESEKQITTAFIGFCNF
jgi:hypothetical protein